MKLMHGHQITPYPLLLLIGVPNDVLRGLFAEDIMLDFVNLDLKGIGRLRTRFSGVRIVLRLFLLHFLSFVQRIYQKL